MMYMLSGKIRVDWGPEGEKSFLIGPGDLNVVREAIDVNSDALGSRGCETSKQCCSAPVLRGEAGAVDFPRRREQVIATRPSVMCPRFKSEIEAKVDIGL